jgi:predicted Co/Zn/Cd cation transporter (cation efflux family)
MKKRIEQVSLVQNAKVVAVLYLLLSLPVLVILWVAAAFTGHGVVSGVALVVFPLVYALSGFVFTLIGAWIYNVVASMVGGFEFTTKEVSTG